LSPEGTNLAQLKGRHFERVFASFRSTSLLGVRIQEMNCSSPLVWVQIDGILQDLIHCARDVDVLVLANGLQLLSLFETCSDVVGEEVWLNGVDDLK
jgi:hypothetical protein